MEPKKTPRKAESRTKKTPRKAESRTEAIERLRRERAMRIVRAFEKAVRESERSANIWGRHYDPEKDRILIRARDKLIDVLGLRMPPPILKAKEASTDEERRA